jgi:hypothetical protein
MAESILVRAIFETEEGQRLLETWHREQVAESDLQIHWAKLYWTVGERAKLVDHDGRVISLATVTGVEKSGGEPGLPDLEYSVHLDEPRRLLALGYAYGGKLPPLRIEPA